MIRDNVMYAIRRWNRIWLDRLDPDYPPPEPEAPPVSVYAEPTPNPDAMKFVSSVPVPALSAGHPLQEALLATDGVASPFPDLHEAALKLLAHKFARLKTSEELIEELASF